VTVPWLNTAKQLVNEGVQLRPELTTAYHTDMSVHDNIQVLVRYTSLFIRASQVHELSSGQADAIARHIITAVLDGILVDRTLVKHETTERNVSTIT
jgi:hypothetical protein